ncbi:MAG: DUF3427 domain-containing protein [Lachnospiraceae bacterium]|nr:DUF3427 domain-containing protein [Lachnospiraceae bacterium]
MAKTENVELTVLCLIQDGDKILLQNRVKKDWKGYTLPGGHVEHGESFVDAVKRESLTGAIGVLTGSFVSGDAERQKYSEVDVLQEQNGLYHTYARVSRFQEKLRRRAFRQQMEDLVTLGTLEYEAVGRTVQNRRFGSSIRND